MTLVVGIRCTDGVVIGTDSAVTFGTGQHSTIEQPLRQKIDIIESHIIVAGTGQVGLSQRFVDIVEQHWKGKSFRGKNVVDVGRMLAQSAIKDFSETEARLGSYGALVAVPCGKTVELIESAVADFQPEVKTKDIWYASMGSGQLVADPLLGFIRKTFWGDDPPSRQDGVFAVTMVLKLGCEMAPTGVAEPIQIAMLGPDPENKGKLSARGLKKEELLEHEGNVKSAIEYFSKYRNILHGTDTPTPELPPAPS